jgi:hypothetical protein
MHREERKGTQRETFRIIVHEQSAHPVDERTIEQQEALVWASPPSRSFASLAVQ